MFEHWKRARNAETVSMEDFFDGTGAEIEEVETKRKTPLTIVKALASLVAISAVAGMILSIVPLMGISAGVQAVEPAAEYWKNLPEDLEDIAIGEKNVMLDKDGNVFAEVWTENRSPLTSVDQISKYARNGLIATEDKNFYQHGGFDIAGTARAALSGRGGGSGITQQLVKNLRFYNMAGKDKKNEATEQSIARKIQELKYAVGYEKKHSKDEILLAYFNTVALGGPSTYSIQSAAQYYFGKDAKDLDLAESAVLVGTVQNPSRYDLSSQDADTKTAYKDRQKLVLGRMVSEGYITQSEADKAYQEELKLVYKKTSNGNCASSKYPFYCEYVLDYLESSPKLGETQEERDAILQKGGLQIKTYLDAAGTDAAQQQLKNDYGNTNRVVVPVAVVNPGTGGVSVIAANRDYGTGEGETTINMALNPAGTGSTYKMMTLAAALNSGMTENDLAFSSQCPLVPGAGYDYPSGGFQNSTSCALQGGFLNFKQATAYSSNTWFVTLEMKVGVEKVKEFSKSVGLAAPDTINSRSLSYTLGTTENSPVNMAAAFATFANEGIYCPATPVAGYEYSDGTRPVVPDTYDPSSDSCRRVMSPKSASIVLQAMRANVSGEIPNAFGVDNRIPGYETAAKSGTNQLYNSAWSQLTGNFSIYANAYDPVAVSRGMDYVPFRGHIARWFDHPSATSATDILTTLIQKDGYKGLDFDNADTTMAPVPIEQRDFFTVPSVVGMSPEEAVSTIRSLGIDANVKKEKVQAPSGYGSGIIVEQSLEAGTQLPVGTKKEMVLTVSQ